VPERTAPRRARAEGASPAELGPAASGVVADSPVEPRWARTHSPTCCAAPARTPTCAFRAARTTSGKPSARGPRSRGLPPTCSRGSSPRRTTESTTLRPRSQPGSPCSEGIQPGSACQGVAAPPEAHERDAAEHQEPRRAAVSSRRSGHAAAAAAVRVPASVGLVARRAARGAAADRAGRARRGALAPAVRAAVRMGVVAAMPVATVERIAGGTGLCLRLLRYEERAKYDGGHRAQAQGPGGTPRDVCSTLGLALCAFAPLSSAAVPSPSTRTTRCRP